MSLRFWLPSPGGPPTRPARGGGVLVIRHAAEGATRVGQAARRVPRTAG